jgi:glycosyltransferase involved in cell wall biosynthesis
MSSKLTITLYVMSWGTYWDKFGTSWSEQVNNFTTQPDEIIIVSDGKVDFSTLKHSNVKNIIVPIDKNFYPIGNYRNAAIANSSSDWVVCLDLDDTALPNYLDNLDPSADICGFSFIEKEYDRFCTPNNESLNKRLLGISDNFMIPSGSAIKRSVFDKIRYEESGYEDRVFYATASKLNLKVVNVNPTEPRFIYSGFHPTSKNIEIIRITEIYTRVLRGNRNIYCFWNSKEFTENIKNAYHSLCQHSGCNIVLINSETFYKFENIEIPIHKEFYNLSDADKNNYVKAYMMYFYGEGYADLNPCTFNWNTYFDELFLSKSDSTVINPEYFISKPKTKSGYKYLSSLHEQINKK